MVARDALPAAHADEIAQGERFEFGRNWQRFLRVIDEERIAEAELSLREMLRVDSLEGRTFLDVGSGSGLFSLAALRLGAKHVHSFDFDPASVACTRELRRRYAAHDSAWTIEQGSVLDRRLVAGLGRWDVVYSWGVLHHTGAMWRAFEVVQALVSNDGLLFVSIYNDQGPRSRLWLTVKRAYNSLPSRWRLPFTMLVMGPRELLALGKAIVEGKPRAYIESWTSYKQSRGMSRWHDIVDWIGGFPFEVAKPEEVFDFLHERGFHLERLVTRGGTLGCNQFVFRRSEHLAPHHQAVSGH